VKRGRFAPSPTGALHLGSAAAALFSAARARALGGAHVLRMEDIDGPREVPGAAEAIVHLFSESKRAADLPPPNAPDMNPVGVEANRRNLEVAIDCVHRLGMIPRRFSVEELLA